MKIGIIGLGRLGEALARGLDRFWDEGDICGFNRTHDKALLAQKQAPRLALLKSATEIFEQCDPVFLWTRPEDAAKILEANAGLIKERRPCIISCVMNVALADYTPRWAWCLPNVNMPTGCGVTMIHYAPTLETADRETLEGILSSVGALYEASAVDIPYYSALMSCGPALYATMFELFADTLADKRGFNRDLCRKMVRDCVEGTLLLQELDGADTDEVVKRVAHPGGPSEAGTLFLKEKLPGLYQEMLVKMKKW